MQRSSLEYRFFILLLVTVSLAFGWILLPFYGAVFWAVVLTILFMPLQRRMLRRCGQRRNLATLATTLVCLLIAVLPVIISRRSGTLGDEIRADNGALAAHMLESIRGLDETIQYGGGSARLSELTGRTDALSKRQGDLNKLTGTNLALANTAILLFDIAMFVLCAALYAGGKVDFDGFLIPLVSLMSSFGPVTALAALGTTLQATVASGARVLAIMDEEPERLSEIKGKLNGAGIYVVNGNRHMRKCWAVP